MPSLRQRWEVSWNGDPPIVVTTTVHDLITAVDTIPVKSAKNRVAVSTALIYSALVRTGACSLPYEDWLDVLDMYDEVKPHAVNGDGPTNPAASPQEPLLSGVLPVRIGNAGSDGILEH